MTKNDDTSLPRRSLYIFDLDGVLVDSWETWFRLVNFTLDTFGGQCLDRDGFQEIWGQGMTADRDMFFPAMTVEELQAFYEEHFARFVEHTTCFKDTEPVLNELKERGKLLALASNSPRAIVDHILRHYGLTRLFDTIVGCEEVKEPKPAPDMIVACLNRLHAAAGEALFVGDSNYDREASQRAGVLFAGYGTDGDIRVNRLRDLLPQAGTGSAG